MKRGNKCADIEQCEDVRYRCVQQEAAETRAEPTLVYFKVQIKVGQGEQSPRLRSRPGSDPVPPAQASSVPRTHPTPLGPPVRAGAPLLRAPLPARRGRERRGGRGPGPPPVRVSARPAGRTSRPSAPRRRRCGPAGSSAGFPAAPAGSAGRAAPGAVPAGPPRGFSAQRPPGTGPGPGPPPPSLPASLWKRRRPGCASPPGPEAAGEGEGAALAGRCEAGDRAPGTGPGLGQARSSRLLLPARTEPPGWQEAVSAAARALQAGGLVAVPTDTVYGVACLAQDSGAVRSIYSLKGRNGRKPLAICVGDVDRLFRYCRVEVPEELLHDLLPGPVTLVLQRSEELNKELNPFTSLVGVRVPNHPFIRELARACSGPLALTSANISCQGSTLSVTEFQELWPQLSLIIDGGPLGDLQSPESRLGSTVVDLSVPGKFSIIRPGCALASTVEILRHKYGLIPASS